MRILKITAITILVLLLLLLLANFGVSYYIEKKLPEIIEKEKDFPYSINYKDLDIDVIGGNLTMHKAALAPKDSIAAAVKNGIFGTIESIGVSGVSLWQFFKYDRIVANSVTINKPEIILYHREKKYSVESDIEKPFKNAVRTGSLTVTNGSFKMLDVNKGFKLKASNVNFNLYKIKVDSTTLDDNIPVRYRDYRFTCDSLFYNAGQYYTITANKFVSTDSTLSVADFKMTPKHTRRQFSNSLSKELDQFNLKAAKIDIPKLDWGFVRDTLYVHTPEVVLNNIYANIYRSKEPNDDPSRKKLYSELLRSVKFDLKADKILIKNSLVVYEEQLNFSKPAAKVTFSKFYATVANAYSPVNKEKLPRTTIDVECMFMKSAPLKVSWSFNTPDFSDAFSITGSLKNIKTEEVNPVSKPLMNATTTGDINEVRFVFNGNRENATGTFAIDYDDLKVGIYKKDGKKKNKVVSAIGNLLVKNDTDGKLKKVNVSVTRSKDKSVFNFLWKFVMEGLKQTVLPKIVT